MDKEKRKFCENNWREIINLFFSRLDTNEFFEGFFEDIDCYEKIYDSFFKGLEEVILSSEGWFASHLSRKGKIALLKELIGESEIIKNGNLICESCGSDDFDLLDEKGKIKQLCKMCGKKLSNFELIEKEY